MIFSILELVTCFKPGGATAWVDYEPRGREEKKFGNHCHRSYVVLPPKSAEHRFNFRAMANPHEAILVQLHAR